MSKATERLLQAAAVILLLWFGWSLAKESIVWNFNLSRQAQQLEQALAACRGEKK